MAAVYLYSQEYTKARPGLSSKGCFLGDLLSAGLCFVTKKHTSVTNAVYLEEKSFITGLVEEDCHLGDTGDFSG